MKFYEYAPNKSIRLNNIELVMVMDADELTDKSRIMIYLISRTTVELEFDSEEECIKEYNKIMNLLNASGNDTDGSAVFKYCGEQI